MNDLCADIGYKSINHYGEQLCGDHIDIVEPGDDSTVIVLSDGLGSGVKASILSTLTSKIISTMLAEGLSLEECVGTIAATLPVCSVRGVAYSTFTIIHLKNNQSAELIQYDNPHIIAIRNEELWDYPKIEMTIGDKKIYRSVINLMENDIFMKFKPAAAVSPAVAVSDGAVEFRLRTEYTIGRKSRAVVDTVFYASNPRIDFEMTIDWDEPHTMLKASFDVDVRSATCKNEIQFGHIERPTTRNTKSEKAKFEVCNHKWSALCESRYGVALLNNCKYGISVEGSEMMLTLHKGGNRPDTTNDSGKHTITYSLLPFAGAFSAENVIYPAYELNCSPVLVKGSLKEVVTAPVSISAPNIICESIKCAEDVEGAYVLRLYECERNRTNCTLTFPDTVKVYETNMLENIKNELSTTENKVELEFHPFEIKTLLVKPE